MICVMKEPQYYSLHEEWKLWDFLDDFMVVSNLLLKRQLSMRFACCRRIDEPFTQHLESEGLEFLQFTFRWVVYTSPQARTNLILQHLHNSPL